MAKIVFSGIQPTGRIHLGNYIGAVRRWPLMQDECDCIYSIVNLHAITLRQDPKALAADTRLAFACLLASGLDPDKSTLFVQSHVSQHSELSWLLSCYTMFGELSRMTQFKDKSSKNQSNINAGLFTYPVLMAADILLYKTSLVPVGQDQKQHVELARDIAIRFNNIYGDIFTIPQPHIASSGAKIMSLADPTKKMSKSDSNLNSCACVLDSPDEIMRKFKRAVTDSGSEILRGEGKDGINNLITIYANARGITAEQVEREFEGKGYGVFKTACGEAVVELFRPFREKVDDLVKYTDYLDSLMRLGAEKAEARAADTLKQVSAAIGMLVRP